MFVPTEAIGSIVAKIITATGMPLETLEFREDKCVVTFTARAQAKDLKANTKAQSAVNTNVKFTFPPGPWKKTGEPGIWECNGEKRQVRDLANDRGIPSSVMSQRLMANGMLDTQRNRSKFEKIAKRERLSLTD